MHVSAFSKNEKARLVEQANKLKSMKHPFLPEILSVWGNSAQGELVMITYPTQGESLQNCDRGVILREWQTWIEELLRVVCYLHSHGITPLDLNLANIIRRDHGITLEDCLFAHDFGNISLAMYKDESIDSSDELSSCELLDSVSVGLVLLSLFTGEPLPDCICDVLIQVKDGTMDKKVEVLKDKTLVEFLKCCLGEKNRRWSVERLLAHDALREISHSDYSSPRSTQSPSDSPEFSSLVPLSLVIETDSGKQAVSFQFDTSRDTEERVAEELLKELYLGRHCLQPLADAIRKKLRERRSADLLTLSPQMTPVCSPFEWRGDLKRVDSLQKMDNVQNRLPRSDQSCPSLIDIGQSAGSDVLMRKGAEGNSVRRLQEALRIVLNVELHLDGVYSKKTEQLVKEFQASQDLEVTGVVEGHTWATLARRYPKLLQSDEQVRSSALSKP